MAPRKSSVDTDSGPLLDAVDHLCYQVDTDPVTEEEFYRASTPEEMVALAVDSGILIEAEDFRALLRSGSTEWWVVRGEAGTNPIVHLQQVFRIPALKAPNPIPSGRFSPSD